jgi:uncharacterized Zn-finger protein
MTVSADHKNTLRDETVRFVKKVITEVYGQKASQTTINTTANRVMRAMPSSPKSHPGVWLNLKNHGQRQ